MSDVLAVAAVDAAFVAVSPRPEIGAVIDALVSLGLGEIVFGLGITISPTRRRCAVSYKRCQRDGFP